MTMTEFVSNPILLSMYIVLVISGLIYHGIHTYQQSKGCRWHEVGLNYFIHFWAVYINVISFINIIPFIDTTILFTK